MARRGRVLIVSCVTLAACGGGGRQAATHRGGGPQAAAVRACAAGDLRTSVGHTVVAAGTSGGYIVFTNVRTAPCALNGWPRLVGLTAGGRATLARRTHDTEFGPHLAKPRAVTLAPGGRADAVFAASDAADTGTGRCPRPYRRLRVTPPRGAGSALLSGWIRALAAYLPACHGIRVTFVAPPARFYKG